MTSRRAAWVRHLAALADLGRRALRGAPLQSLFDAAVQAVPRILGVEYCKVLERLPDGSGLILRAGVGWKPGSVGRVTVAAGRDSQAGYTLLRRRVVVVTDLRRERRFRGMPLLHEHGVVSGISTVLEGRERPWGVLGAHTPRGRRFGHDEVLFLQAVANVLSAAIQRAEADRDRHELLERASSTREAERRRIARELHDDAGHSLSAVLMGLRAVEAGAGPAETRARLATLRAMTRQAIEDLARLVRGLHPAALDGRGLVAALTALARDFGRSQGLDARVRTTGLRDARLPRATETALYRIAQEALANVARHARAATVSLTLARRAGAVELRVTDDGRGFDVAAGRLAPAPPPGLGLQNIRERAELLGGTLTIRSRPGRGTTLSVTVPWPA